MVLIQIPIVYRLTKVCLYPIYNDLKIFPGFPEHIEYTPGSGRKKLAESAHLDICDESCKPDHITVKMTLATKHIGKGCDRDTYSISSQRKLCGKSLKTRLVTI